MTSQRRVKEYLEMNKISPLFEDLMAKLMHSMPSDPLAYLVSVLERKIEKKKQVSGEMMRKSTGTLPAAQVGDSISAWAVSGSGGIVSKDSKSYEKPWTTNAKPKSSLRTEASPTRLSRSTKADRSPARKSGTKVGWNPDTKTPTGDFDELWRSKQDQLDKPASSPAPKQSHSPTRRQRRGLASQQDLELTFTSHGYSGPRRPADSQDDEFTSPKQTYAPAKATEILDQKMSRFGKRRQRPSQNKLEMKGLLEVDRRDSGLEEEVDIDDQEDGADVYEDEEELKREGVTSVQSTGLRIRPSGQSETTPVVRVSICGRCARVMTAGSEPVSRRAGTFTDSPTYDVQSSAQFTANLDDDEFESVSQVSGPRRPVWIEDDKVSSPRKGASMLASGGQPHKGHPMYTRPGDDSSPDITEEVTDQSSPPQVSWNDASPVTGDEDPPSLDSPAPTVASARPWVTPADSDITDMDWAPERVRRARIHANSNGRY